MRKTFVAILNSYCPNQQCPHHTVSKGPVSKSRLWYRKHGFYPKQCRPGHEQRYRCRYCGVTFSANLFSLEYRNRRLGLNPKILSLFANGFSNHQIARSLSLNEKSVRLRIRKLSQQAMLSHSERVRRFKISEEISYDGVENFAKSQYEPNYINQAIGSRSFFLYDFNFSPLNRKGRMSERQKIKKLKIEEKLGAFPKDAVCHATTNLLRRLAHKCPANTHLKLVSDEHYQYRKSINNYLKREGIRIEHATISAKAPRCFKHILFPVNHMDLMLRQHVKAFSRETISFSKTHGAMIQKYALYAMVKNYLRVQFTKKQKQNPLANKRSPAMAAGVETKVLKFCDFFNVRRNITQIHLNEEWREFYQARSTFPRMRETA